MLAYSTVQSQQDLASKASQANHLVHHLSTTLCIPARTFTCMPFVHHHHYTTTTTFPISSMPCHPSTISSIKLSIHLFSTMQVQCSKNCPTSSTFPSSQLLQIQSPLLNHTTCQFQFSTLPSYFTISLEFSFVFHKQYQHILSHIHNALIFLTLPTWAPSSFLLGSGQC